MNCRIGVVGHHFSKVPLPEAIDLATNMEVEYFELSAIPTKTKYGASRTQLDLNASKKEWAIVKEFFDSSELKISAIGGYNDFALDRKKLKQEKDNVLKSCEAASFFGVDVIRVFAGDLRENIEREALISQAIRCFQDIMPIVSEYGVYLAIENHTYLANDGPTLLRILEEVNSEWLKITLDIGNFHYYNHSIEETHEYIKMLAAYTVHTHLKNVVNVNGRPKLVELGKGAIDVELTTRELLRSGFNRPFTVAYEGDFSSINSVKRGVRESVDYMRSILDKFDGC